MGCGGSKASGSKANEPEKPPANGAGKDRITDNDKAILDIKGRMRKLKTYEQKLE